jgi:hypothetical protein
MKKEFVPFYISRAVLSIVFALAVFGISWKALVMAIAFFALFLLYLHSGWFSIDSSHPLTPIRRDDRAREIQRKALIAAVVVGLLLYVFLPQANTHLGLSIVVGPVVISLSILTYFVTQYILLARA